MALLSTVGQTISGLGMGLGLPKLNFYGLTPQGLGAALAGSTQPFPSWRVSANEGSPLPSVTGTSGGTPTTSFGQLGGAVPKPQGQPQGQPQAPVRQDTRLDELAKTSRNPAQEDEYQRLLREVQSSIDTNREAEIARQREFETKQRSAIEASYQPVFAELDRQLAGVPGQQAALQEQVGTLAGQQLAESQDVTKQQTGQLEAARGTEEQRFKEGLQGLEQDVRNLLQATSFYLGARGAADSSATGQAGELVTRAGQQARAKLQVARNQAMTAIDQKIQSVNDISAAQQRKIDEWKSNKIFEVSQWATDQLNQLNAQRATAQGEQARAVANLIQNTQTQFLDYMRQLDQQVTGFKQGVLTWQTQRAAEMEDYKTKLSLAGQYTPTTQQTISDLTGLAKTLQTPAQTTELEGATGTLFGQEGDWRKTLAGLTGILPTNQQPALLPATATARTPITL